MEFYKAVLATGGLYTAMFAASAFATFKLPLALTPIAATVTLVATKALYDIAKAAYEVNQTVERDNELTVDANKDWYPKRFFFITRGLAYGSLKTNNTIIHKAYYRFIQSTTLFVQNRL